MSKKYLILTKEEVVDAVKDEIMSSFSSLSDHYITIGIVHSAMNRIIKGPHIEIAEENLPSIEILSNGRH